MLTQNLFFATCLVNWDTRFGNMGHRPVDVGYCIELQLNEKDSNKQLKYTGKIHLYFFVKCKTKVEVMSNYNIFKHINAFTTHNDQLRLKSFP